MKKNIYILVLAVITILFSSCVGISFNIQMNRDGSGRLTMEYRISSVLNSLGTLDGNESMPVIPVGRLDWERTVQRIPGTRLVSHSVRETSQDTLINVTLDFSNPETLTAILSISGGRVSANVNGNSGSFEIIFTNPEESFNLDQNLITLARTFFTGYNFSFSFNAPGNSTMTITDGNRNTIPSLPAAVITNQGRRSSLSMDIIDLVSLTDGLGLIITW